MAEYPYRCLCLLGEFQDWTASSFPKYFPLFLAEEFEAPEFFSEFDP
jgi:hypothetical protein